MTLRQRVAETQATLARAESELSELEQQLAALPMEYEIWPQLDRRPWGLVLLALLPLLIAAGMLALHHSVLAARERDDAPELEVMREQAKRCLAKAVEARRSRDALRRQLEAAPYAGVRASPGTAGAYPGLTGVDELRRLPPERGDRLLRWVNIGVAACRIDERPVADWALTALSAQIGPDYSFEERRNVNRAQSALLVGCMLQGPAEKSD